ncbi:MAG: hypothetical protein KIS66_10290 [Fimbriimonadaceae bacterium]|nr:hypothetical protein [Fimbriimonadaceae bacterium]
MSDASREITVQELRDALAGPNPPVLVDVREPHELRISALAYDVHIPSDDLPNRLDELDRNADLVIYCRTGNRSGVITEYLVGLGYPRVSNLVGGINAWAKKIDRTMRQY